MTQLPTSPLRLTEVFYTRRSYTDQWEQYRNWDVHVKEYLPRNQVLVYSIEKEGDFIVEHDEVEPKNIP